MIYGYIIKWYDPNSVDLATIEYSWEIRSPMYTVCGHGRYESIKVAADMLYKVAQRNHLALRRIKQESRAITA